MKKLMARRQFLKVSLKGALWMAALGNSSFLSVEKALAAWPVSPVLKKFVTPLPGVYPVDQSFNGITLSIPDKTLYKGVDYYQIGMREFSQQLHPNLGATKLWGYYDLTNPTTPIRQRHLGGVIVAQQNRPVRITYSNNLPAVHILPVDTSLPGAETGQAQNRAAVHLHGGFVPWMSDGGPFHWFTPGKMLTGSLNVPWLPDNNGVLTDDYWYPNAESARMLWYHDHAQGITRLNAYAGLASAYIIRDQREAQLVRQGLPDFLENGGREVPLVFQDKVFNLDGTLWYPNFYDPTRWPTVTGSLPLPVVSCVPEFSGDTLMVNGMIYPYLDVEPRRYRFRILNACNTRFMRLRIVYAKGSTFPDNAEPNTASLGPKFTYLGTEGGFLPKPFSTNIILLAPAERADILVDFASCPVGSSLILYNDAPSPFPFGSPFNDFYPGNPQNPIVVQPGYGPNTRTVLQFRVISTTAAADPPLNLSKWPVMDPTPIIAAGSKTVPPNCTERFITLNEDFDSYGRLIQRIGTNVPLYPGTYGRNYLDPPTEFPLAGTTEVWYIANLTADTHPMHFHLEGAQVAYRWIFNPLIFNGQIIPPATGLMPPQMHERGWKDTVLCPPNTITAVLMRFNLPPDPVVKGLTVPVPKSNRTGVSGHEYVYHCHILEHEEHDMMRPLVVT